jgi:hypothetical protein
LFAFNTNKFNGTPDDGNIVGESGFHKVGMDDEFGEGYNQSTFETIDTASSKVILKLGGNN